MRISAFDWAQFVMTIFLLRFFFSLSLYIRLCVLLVHCVASWIFPHINKFCLISRSEPIPLKLIASKYCCRFFFQSTEKWLLYYYLLWTGTCFPFRSGQGKMLTFMVKSTSCIFRMCRRNEKVSCEHPRRFFFFPYLI